MKRYTRKWFVLSALVVAFGASGAAQATPIVRLVASATLLNPNDLVTVSIVVEQLGSGAAPSVGAWSLDITLTDGTGGTAPQSALYGTPGLNNEMNPAGTGSTSEATPVLGAGNVALAQIANGDVSVSDLNTLQSDTFILAQVVYQMGGLPGVSLLELCTPNTGSCLLGDAAGFALAFGAEPQNGLVLTVAELPEPGVTLALGLPLVFLAARRRVARR